MRALIMGLAAIAAVFFTVPSFATPQAGAAAADDAAMLAGPWRGVWTAPGPEDYQGQLALTESADGRVSGQIDWMLVRTPRDELQSGIGQHGVEYVEGAYDSATHALVLHGVRLDDPHQILGPDAYRLIVTDDDQYLVGATQNGGNWAGRIDFRRVLTTN